MANTMTLSEAVAEEIRVLLVRRRMSGRQLAAMLNVSQTWMSTRLNGTTPIDLNDLERIAAALGVDVMDLFPREGRLIATAATTANTARVSNARKTRPAKRPGPNGHPNRTQASKATRRPVRTSPAHAASAPGGRIPMRTNHEQGVTYGA